MVQGDSWQVLLTAKHVLLPGGRPIYREADTQLEHDLPRRYTGPERLDGPRAPNVTCTGAYYVINAPPLHFLQPPKAKSRFRKTHAYR